MTHLHTMRPCSMSSAAAQWKRPTHCLHKQEPHGCGDQVCQHRELLAIIFACHPVSIYLLGRSFTAESNNKPLQMIATKNLANMLPHLQRMLLELQKFNVTKSKFPVLLTNISIQITNTSEDLNCTDNSTQV